ncbi:ubiquitin-specific protease otu1 [Malassezia sp. CBS 17886]|nr:ubiquitin-specific protease otu1 [Malassezia sp. CBS 17886]
MIRLRHANGTMSHALDGITLAGLQQVIQAATGIPAGDQILKSGVPPHRIRAQEADPETRLTDAPFSLRPGDMVTVETGSVGAGEQHGTHTEGTHACPLRLEVMPDDNSCLYHALAFLVHGVSADPAPMRRLARDHIAAHPAEYNDGVLGEMRSTYMVNMLQPQTWGGSVELAAFAELFGKEIWCWDVRSGLCHRFGEGRGHSEFWMLAYSGIHYDVIVAPRAGESGSVFSQVARAEASVAGMQLLRKLQNEH